MTRVVCALSGGGAKTAAHLGALRALAEHGLAPRHYVATSMGAVIAAALAAGVTHQQALDRLATLRRGDLGGLSPHALLGVYGASLFRLEPLRRLIARFVPARRFADLEVPLTVTTVDLETGALVLLGAGGHDVPLIEALTAACALPIYFPPVPLVGRRLADGGLREVLPLETATRFAPDVVFAVHVGPSFDERPPERRARIPLLVRRHGQAQRILMAAQTEAALARWRREEAAELILVLPRVMAETTFAVELALPYAEEGYQAARRALAARRVPQ
ncbi:MAG TPA: patatin-like phospholipase family protein [Gemmatimonadales bacterium]|nr:patatin-like phospholipase family protein [Gemmatimonadales bacterium]